MTKYIRNLSLPKTKRLRMSIIDAIILLAAYLVGVWWFNAPYIEYATGLMIVNSPILVWLGIETIRPSKIDNYAENINQP